MKTEFELTVLSSDRPEHVDKLLTLHQEDPNRAFLFWSLNRDNIYSESQYVRLKGEKSSSFIRSRKLYGFSITKKLYSRNVDDEKIIITNKSIHSKMINGVRHFMSDNFTYAQKELKEAILAKFPHLEWMKKDGHILTNLGIRRSINTFIKHKLSSLEKAIKYFIPDYPANVIISVMRGDDRKKKDVVTYLVSRSIKNKHLVVDKNFFSSFISKDFINSYYVEDTLSLCEKLGKEFSLKIFPKKLKILHDELSKEVSNLTLEFDNREYRINNLFVGLDLPDWELIRNSKRLAQEGMNMNNCVANYANRINYGDAIYHITNNGIGYTAHVSGANSKTGYKILQISSRGNVSISEELKDELEEKFNRSVLLKEATEDYYKNHVTENELC